MDYKKQAMERFKKDLFATEAAGIIIEDVAPGYARCSMNVEERHLNAEGYVMGGAIYTLADFTFAVGANCGNETTVTLSSNISYVNATKGPVLYGEATSVKDSRSVSFYDIIVSDGEGKIVARVSTTGFRKEKPKL